MALSGTLTGSYHSLGNYRIKLSWSATQDIANNRSTVTAKVYLDADWNLSYSARKYGKTTVNGSSQSWSSDDSHSGTGEWLVASHTFTVNHNSDGTKSFSMSAYFNLNITIGNGYIGRLYVSGSATLNTIPRKSTISSLGNFTIGAHPSISFSVAYSGFKHDIVAKVNNKDMQRWDNLSSLPTSLAFNSTADYRMYSELSNSTSGTMRVYLNTRNSSGDLIGQDYKDVAISVSSSIIPSIDSVSISEAVSGLATQFGGYIQNKSKLSIAMSASGNKYSAIRNYKITANGRSYSSSSATTEILKSSGSNRITFEVTDSRGRKTSTHRDVTVIAYDNPQIYDLSAERSNSAGTLDDQGNYARVNYHAAISSVNSNNTKSFKVSYRLSGASTWTDVALPNTNYSYDTFKIIGPLDVDYSYDIQLVVSDYFSDVPADTSVSSTFTLINFARDKKGLAFGKTYDENTGGRLQVDGDSTFDGRADVNGPFKVNSDAAFMGRTRLHGETRFDGGIESIYIGSNTDLNDLINVGYYYASTNSVASSLINCPTGFAFSLHVEKHAGIKQTLTEYMSNNMITTYVRNYYNGNWGSWFQMPSNLHGANSNGKYWQFDNGLLIFRAWFSSPYNVTIDNGAMGYRSDYFDITFPVSFESPPAVTVSPSYGSPLFYAPRDVTTTKVVGYWYSAFSRGSSGFDSYVTAIGRWK